MKTKSVKVLLLLLIKIVVVNQCLASRDSHKLYRVRVRDSHDKEFIKSLRIQTGYDILTSSDATNQTCKIAVDFYMQKNFEEKLATRNIPYIVLVVDLGSHAHTPLPISLGSRPSLEKFDLKKIYKSQELFYYMENLRSRFPKLVNVNSLGNSSQGQALKAIQISSGGNNKEVILLVAGTNGREWLAPAAAFYTIQQLVEDYNNNRELITAFDWIIFPIVNPDGYEYSLTTDKLWSKTRSKQGKCTGVDLERNFSYMWKGNKSSSDPCNQFYRGSEAFSEPESKAVQDIFKSYRGRIKAYFTIHANGKRICHPWAHTRNRVATEHELESIAVAGTNAISKEHGQDWQVTSQADANDEANGASIDYAYKIEKVPFVYRIDLGAIDMTDYGKNDTDIEPMVKAYWTGISAMAMELTSVPRKWTFTDTYLTSSTSIFRQNFMTVSIFLHFQKLL